MTAEEFRALASSQQTETAFLDQVLRLAKVRGWRSAHFRPAQTSKGWRTAVQGDGKGFVDLVLVRGFIVIFAELKTDTGKLSPEQEAWSIVLAEAQSENMLYELWRPRDWPRIEHILENYR
jgi:hypothetical protein